MQSTALILVLFLGKRTNGKQGKCSHTCYFCTPWGPAKTLVGEPPQTQPLGQNVPKFLSASPSLSLLFLIRVLVGQPEQPINIPLDRHGLPHILLGLSVLGIKSFLPRRQLAALFF